jgi:hypothetical protein
MPTPVIIPARSRAFTVQLSEGGIVDPGWSAAFLIRTRLFSGPSTSWAVWVLAQGLTDAGMAVDHLVRVLVRTSDGHSPTAGMPKFASVKFQRLGLDGASSVSALAPYLVASGVELVEP